MTGMTLLTQALALTKPQTEPTKQDGFSTDDCDHSFDDGLCLFCGVTYAAAHRGFGGNTQVLAPGMRRVPRS
jgi:hypothetical protein